MFIEDLQFFGFNEQALTIFQESNIGKIKQRKTALEEENNRNRILRFIWNVLEYPESGTLAKVVTSLSMVVILLAVVLFSVDTLPEVKYVLSCLNMLRGCVRVC